MASSAAAVDTTDKVDVFAAQASGIADQVADAVRDAVVSRLAKCDKGYRARAVHFLPTTKSYLGDKAKFEILANVSVDTGAFDRKFGFAPSKVLQAVVSISETGGLQSLERTIVLHGAD